MHIKTLTDIIDLCLEEVMLVGNFSFMAVNGGVMVCYSCPVEDGSRLEIQALLKDEGEYSNGEVEVWGCEANGVQTYSKVDIIELIDVLQKKKDTLRSQKPAPSN